MPQKPLDNSRCIPYIYKVGGNEASATRESNMRHKILIRRAIRDDRGRFTGRYHSAFNMAGIPAGFAILQLIVLATVFYFA